MKSLLHKIKRAARIIGNLPRRLLGAADVNDRQLMLLGRQSCWMLRDKTMLNDLSDAEFRVYSQWGEDGILEWLIQNITCAETTFVEFGVENYTEANTRFLIENRNWRGLIMDGSESHMRSVRSGPLYWKHDLQAVTAFITRENINDLLSANGCGGDIGLLSIDIDGNDYWILKAIEAARPSILVVEYNPILGDTVPVTVPYDSGFRRFDAHYSGLYFGASIGAVRHAAEEKGYRFVGTCSNGINAFFVLEEQFSVLEPKLSNITAYPSRHRDSRDRDGALSHTAGAQRLKLIEDMPVICIEDGREARLRDLGPLYSEDWLRGM